MKTIIDYFDDFLKEIYDIGQDTNANCLYQEYHVEKILEYALDVLPKKQGRSKYLSDNRGDFIRLGYNACIDDMREKIAAEKLLLLKKYDRKTQIQNSREVQDHKQE